MQRDTHRDTQRGKLTGTHTLRDIHIQWEKHIPGSKQTQTLRIRHTHTERDTYTETDTHIHRLKTHLETHAETCRDMQIERDTH